MDKKVEASGKDIIIEEFRRLEGRQKSALEAILGGALGDTSDGVSGEGGEEKLRRAKNAVSDAAWAVCYRIIRRLGY